MKGKLRDMGIDVQVYRMHNEKKRKNKKKQYMMR